MLLPEFICQTDLIKHDTYYLKQTFETWQINIQNTNCQIAKGKSDLFAQILKTLASSYKNCQRKLWVNAININEVTNKLLQTNNSGLQSFNQPWIQAS